MNFVYFPKNRQTLAEKPATRMAFEAARLVCSVLAMRSPFCVLTKLLLKQLILKLGHQRNILDLRSL
jgi:hypothetical protein